MKLKLQSKRFTLLLKHPFTISRFTRTTQETIVVSISDGNNTGYGEAIPYPYYGITLEKIEQSLYNSRAIIEHSFGVHPDDLWRQLEPSLRHDYFTLCAINCAYWDCFAQSQNRTTRSYFNDQNCQTPLSDYTIGIDTIAVMKKKILEMPWPIYKIKLGTEHDVEIITALRKMTNAVFRIDANCAWTVEETYRMPLN